MTADTTPWPSQDATPRPAPTRQTPPSPSSQFWEPGSFVEVGSWKIFIDGQTTMSNARDEDKTENPGRPPRNEGQPREYVYKRKNYWQKRDSKSTNPSAREPREGPKQSDQSERKVPLAHGHYRHKNSNKPRFAKKFAESYKQTKEQKDGDPEKQRDASPDLKPGEHLGSTQLAPPSPEPPKRASPGKPPSDITLGIKAVPSPETDVFEKLKSGEESALENLKQLYDTIPDITQSEMVSKEKDWSREPPAEAPVLQPPPQHEEGIPPVIGPAPDPHQPGCVRCGCGGGVGPFLPPMYPPLHPAYYYAAMWNFHYPIPPPPVHRLAQAPSLPRPPEQGASPAPTHKRYISRSTRSPGTIPFVLHSTDALRIVSVRSAEGGSTDFTITADLCNEEGDSLAENFLLHSEESPKMWEQFAFSGNHTVYFRVAVPEGAPSVTVVLTFLHEILVK